LPGFFFRVYADTAADEIEQLRETLHLLRSPANARRLDEAIADVEAGRVTEFDPTR
jgi:PHD/YefM family antitoxin component YafN of YafNO toxin-antitoxin module